MAQTTGLILYLKFDEASGPAQDRAIGMREFSLVNTMARVAGIFGNAVEAQASGDLAQASELRAWRADPMSFACYVYFNSLPSANNKGPHPITILSRGDGTADGYFFGFLSGDTLTFRIIDTANTPYSATYTVVPGDVGQWIHFMGVLVSNSSVTLYKNNVQVGTAVVGGFVKWNNGTPFKVGANFDGKVDEVKLWSFAMAPADRAIAHQQIPFPNHRQFDPLTYLGHLDEPTIPVGNQPIEDRDRFLAIGSTGGVMFSRDGVAWESQGEVVGASVSYLCWNEEAKYWMAFGSAGVLRVSQDGAAWANVAAPVLWTNPRMATVWQNTVVLAADSGLYKSVDGGATWVGVAGLNFAGSAVHGILRCDTLWVAVGADGKVSTSPDTVNWTPRANPSGVAVLRCISRSPLTGRVIVAGDAGFAMYSDDDGATWTSLVTGLGVTATHLVFANDKFLLLGTSDYVTSSDHGISWDSEVFPFADAPVALAFAPLGSWLAATPLRVGTTGNGSTWETTLTASVLAGATTVAAAVQGGYWPRSYDGLFAILATSYIHRSLPMGPLSYIDSPFEMVLLPRDPSPSFLAADLDCSLQQLTAEIEYGPTDSIAISRYWEIEIVPSVAYMRIMEEYPIAPETADTTQIALTFPTNAGIDLNVKRLRYVIEAEGNLADKVKWTTPWIVVSCDGTVIPLDIEFTSTTYSTFCVDISPYVLGRWYRIEWGEVGNGFTGFVQGQLVNPRCVSHGFPEGAEVQVRAFQSFNGGASYEPLTESNHLTFEVPPSTVVPLVLSLASFDYLAFQANLSPFAAGGWYKIEWGPTSNPFIYSIEGQYFGLPITVAHGLPIGTDIQIRAIQSFDDGATWEPLSLSNVVDLEIPSGGGAALHLEVPVCYEDTFDALLTPFLSGGHYRFEFGEVGGGFTNIADGITFTQPANVFHGYPIGTLLQIRAYQSFDGGLTFDPDTMSNTVEIEVTALPNPVPSPLVGGARIVNIYEPQFTLPYVIKPIPGPLPSGFVIDLFWRRAPEPGDPIAPAITDTSLLQLTLGQLYSGRHRYRIAMQLSNGYTYAQTYLLLTRAGVNPGEV